MAAGQEPDAGKKFSNDWKIFFQWLEKSGGGARAAWVLHCMGREGRDKVAGMSDNEQLLSIGAPGLDVDRLVAEIQATADRKMQDGVYSDARVARAEKTNLVHLRGTDGFLTFYLACLRDAVFVDISDFEIRERRSAFAPALVALKKVIWKLLKFYTYRLWSQQNQVNGLVITALQGVEEQTEGRIAKLEARVAELEARLAGEGKARGDG